MANFDEDNKLIWTEITGEEAQLYVNFLRSEIFRHEREAEVSQSMIVFHQGLSKELWESAYLRHAFDITETLSLISKVKEHFRL